jgi:hypothetical protein
MSVSSGNFLDTVAFHMFEIQVPVAFTPKPTSNIKLSSAKKQQAKKRKAAEASLSTATVSEAEDASSSQTSADYLQLAVDNLMLALAKETNQSIQTKIQFVLAKSQHILLNTADIETDSQSDIQQLVQSIKDDNFTKFKDIQVMISNLQFVNTPAVNQLDNAEPASQPVSVTSSVNSTSLTENASSSSNQNAGKKTYTQALKVLIPSQSFNENAVRLSTL